MNGQRETSNIFKSRIVMNISFTYQRSKQFEELVTPPFALTLILGLYVLCHHDASEYCWLFTAWVSSFVEVVGYISHRQGFPDYWLVTSEPTQTDVRRHVHHNSRVPNLNSYP